METKKRNWVFTIYPNKATSGWMDALEQTGLACAISPLRDREFSMEPHFLVLLHYDGPTSSNVVKRLTGLLNATRPHPVDSLTGAYYLLTNKNSPDKYQYSERDIVKLNGFSITKKEKQNEPNEEQSEEMQDHECVNHPAHYNYGTIECIDAMEIMFGKRAVIEFCKLNAFKYIWREGHKGNPEEDRQKAEWYIERMEQYLDDDEDYYYGADERDDECDCEDLY